MEKLSTENFIRNQVRRILEEKEKQKDPVKDPAEKETAVKNKPARRGEVFGSAGRGRLPREIVDIFGGEGGSAAEIKRLATVDPGKLMNNLGVTKQEGETTIERAKAVISAARRGTPAFNQAIGVGEDMSDGERKGVFFSNEGLPQDRLANLFVYDTLRAAAATGFMEMTGHLKVEETEGGVMVYNVRNQAETWGGEE